MPLPSPLETRINDRLFWHDYFFGSSLDTCRGIVEIDYSTESEYDFLEIRDYPDLSDCVVKLWFTDYCALIITLDKALCQIPLFFLDPVFQEPHLIAWDDQAHWHPHVLRWEELDLICRSVALLDPSLPHPGIPLLLLHRFAPICAGDDTSVRFEILRQAWGVLGIFSEKAIDRFVGRFDGRPRGFIWTFDLQHGWTISQEKKWNGLYTTRSPESSFPFEQFNCAIEEARKLLENHLKT